MDDTTLVIDVAVVALRVYQHYVERDDPVRAERWAGVAWALARLSGWDTFDDNKADENPPSPRRDNGQSS